MYDLVLKGGTVVDPSVGLHGVHDIAVQDGRIAQYRADDPSRGGDSRAGGGGHDRYARPD